MAYGVNFRAAQGPDAAEISALALRSKAHWGYSDAFMRQCAPELSYTAPQIDCGEQYFYLCERDRSVLGFYALSQLSAAELELEAMFVAPEAIGQGLGRRLMAHAIEKAKSKGFETILIQSDPNAAPFYEKMGAQLIGKSPSETIPGRFLPSYRLIL